jgi:hypothetical protein
MPNEKSYWEKWKERVDALEKEIHFLITNDTYDIDEDHRTERQRIVEAKIAEYDKLIAESIHF